MTLPGSSPLLNEDNRVTHLTVLFQRYQLRSGNGNVGPSDIEELDQAVMSSSQGRQSPTSCK